MSDRRPAHMGQDQGDLNLGDAMRDELLAENATLRAALLGNLRYESDVLVKLTDAVAVAAKYVEAQAEHWTVKP